jgi:hypothetical protein
MYCAENIWGMLARQCRQRNHDAASMLYAFADLEQAFLLVARHLDRLPQPNDFAT